MSNMCQMIHMTISQIASNAPKTTTSWPQMICLVPTVTYMPFMVSGCLRQLSACLIWHFGCIKPHISCSRWHQGAQHAQHAQMMSSLPKVTSCSHKITPNMHPMMYVVPKITCCMSHVVLKVSMATSIMPKTMFSIP